MIKNTEEHQKALARVNDFMNMFPQLSPDEIEIFEKLLNLIIEYEKTHPSKKHES